MQKLATCTLASQGYCVYIVPYARIKGCVFVLFACKNEGAKVAQWVKRWPSDLAVPGSSPTLAEDLFNRKRDSMTRIQ